jgi:predicted O-methyltransferase YrrM
MERPYGLAKMPPWSVNGRTHEWDVMMLSIRGASRRTVETLTRGAGAGRRDGIAMSALAALDVGFVPWSSMAMRPQGLLTVLNDITVHGRRVVVECGGGVSTIYIAKLLATRGEGHLHTIEHDPAWADCLRGLLHRQSLEAFCTVTLAPLEPVGSPSAWYAAAEVQRLGLADIDLLVVDGPPAYTRERRHARQPALPVFFDRLASDCTVVLDDIDRRGEQDVVDRWEREFPVRFERRALDGAVAVWCRGGRTPMA